MTTKFRRDLFLQRIDLLRTEQKIDHEKDPAFDKLVGLKNWLYRFRHGYIKELTLEPLLVIADHFQVSLDWLLGRTVHAKVQEHRDFTYLAQPTLSLEARREIKTRVRGFLKKTKEALTPVQESCLERDLEDYYLDGFKLPDDDVIKHYLPLCRRPHP